MEIQVLHIDECPNWQDAGDRVRVALDSIGLHTVPVTFVAVRTADEAARLAFAGSPTILVDGKDLFPSKGQTTDLACRVYQTANGFAGAPTEGELKRALAECAFLR